MKQLISLLLLGSASALALAAGDHGGQHGHMAGMHQDDPASAAGRPGEAAKVSRTIEVTMDDNMRFTPERISVKAGETVRFFVRNAGKVPHEMVIGTLSELKEHAEMMRKMPGMKHDDPNAVTLASGQRGGIVWQFAQAGSVDFACLLPGHLEAGMKGSIRVE